MDSIVRTLALALVVILGTELGAAEYPWQEVPATVLPNGELELAQEPYRFVAGSEVRYIDFEGGDDANPGTKQQPWKHHPWDADAGGQAAQHSGPATFVFKGGVI